MANAQQLIERVLAGGLNEAEHPFMVQPPGMLRARNCRRIYGGQLRKRPGMVQLGAATGTLYGLAGSTKELFGLMANGWYRYSSDDDEWNIATTTHQKSTNLNLGAFLAGSLTPGSTKRARIAVYGNYTIVMTDAYAYTVFNSENKPIYFGSGPSTALSRLVSTGNGLFLVVGSGNNLILYSFSTATLTFTLVATFGTDLATNTHFDATYIASSNKILVAYQSQSAGVINVVRVTQAGAIDDFYIGAELAYTTIGGNAPAIVMNGDDAFVAYGLFASTATRVIKVATGDMTLSAGPTTVITTNYLGISGLLSGTTLHWFADSALSPNDNGIIRHGTCSTSLASVSSAVFLRGAMCAGWPFTAQGVVHMPCQSAIDGTKQTSRTLFVATAQATAGVAIALGRMLYGQIYSTNASEAIRHDRTVTLPDGQFGFLAYTVRSVDDDFTGVSIYDEVGVSVVTVSPQTHFRTAEIGQHLLIDGMTLGRFGTPQVSPQVPELYAGLQMYPENIDAAAFTLSNGAGLLTNSGVYQWRLVYLYIDEAGNRWWSSPSVEPDAGTSYATRTLGAADDTVVVPAPTLRAVPFYNGKVYLVLFRTTNGGANFHRTALVANDATADSVNITDLTSDAVLETNELLYTTGGELDNIMPPAAYNISADGKRFYLIPAENRSQLWVSKPMSAGRGVEFSTPGLVFDLPAVGQLQQVISVDNALVLFSESSISYMTGEGKDARGNGGYSNPIKIPGSRGVYSRNSVVQTPDGIMFQGTDKVIYLLDRSFQIQPIGAQVQFTSGSTVLAAHYLPYFNGVIFLFSDTTQLFYDIDSRSWFTWVFTATPVASCVWNDTLVWGDSSGNIYKLDTSETVFQDDGTDYNLKIQTDWIRPAGIQQEHNYNSLLILGTYRSPHTLTVKVYKNYDTSAAAQTETITVASSVTPYQFRVNLEFGMAQAIMVEIEETSTSGSGHSCSLSAILVEAAPLGRSHLVTASQTV